MNNLVLQIETFHRKAGHPVGTHPCQLVSNRREADYLQRRLHALCQAAQQTFQGDNRLETRIIWMLGELWELLTAETPEDQVDALLDLMVFALGTFVEMGFRPGVAFETVMACNMAKVTNGVSRRKSDGKIQKPGGWTGPEAAIRIEWDRQVALAMPKQEEVLNT